MTLYFYVLFHNLKVFSIAFMVVWLTGCSLSAELESLFKSSNKVSVTIASPSGLVSNGTIIPITVNLSEGFEITKDNFQVTNGTIINITGEGSQYTLDIVPDGDGNVTVSFPSTTFIGVDGSEKFVVGETFEFTVDSVKPSVQLSTSLSSPNNVSVIPVTVPFHLV